MENHRLELYVISTPIGNLEDITLRAIRILKELDIIACEDTRVTGKLIQLLDLPKKQLVSYHDHNEQIKSEEIIKLIQSGKSVGLVSDAGTPTISDPGYRLIKASILAGIEVVSVPGVSSILAGLACSGFASNQFHFYGFPPQKKGRKAFIERISQQESTSIILESTHRIEKIIEELANACGADRQICIARELTKLHEEKVYLKLGEAKELVNKRKLKGEIVILLEGNKS